MCGITKKSPISASRKMNVTLDANSASLNKRDRCTLCHRKKDRKYQSLCSKCGKYVCAKHLDIVCINCAWLLGILLLLSLFSFSFVFICMCF